jgi:hypothetical protein
MQSRTVVLRPAIPAASRLALCLAATLALACGGDTDGPGGGSGSRLSLDQHAAVEDSVSAAGKVLSSTSHGVTYTLTIPAGAVKEPTLITMTPVVAIDSLGLSRLVGAVDLQPQGLVLGRAATLRIAVSHPPGSGEGLVGFNYEGDADSVVPLLATDSTAAISLSIRHFSGAGAAYATLPEIQAFFPHPALSNQSQAYVDSMFELTTLSPRDFVAEQALMRLWFSNVVLPGLQGAGNDVALLLAMSEYDFWRNVQTSGHLIPDDPLFQPQRDSFAVAAQPVLQLAVSENNTTCADLKDLGFASNVLYWQEVAHGLGVDRVGSGLDRATVLASLCVQVAFLTVAYPNPATVGVPHSLDVEVELRFPSDGSLLIQPFSMAITPVGMQQSGPITGFTDALGNFTTVLTPAQATISVGIKACLFSAQVPYADVCGTSGVLQGATDLSGLWSGGGFLTGIADLVITQNQNAVHGDYAAAPDGFHAIYNGTITATLSTDTLYDFTVEVVTRPGFTCPGTFTSVPVFVLAGQSFHASVSGTDCSGGPAAFTMEFYRVATTFSVSGHYYADPTQDCSVAVIDCADVEQQGNILLIHMGSGTWRATISGTTFSGTQLGQGSCIFQLCPGPPGPGSPGPITGSFTSGSISGTVTDPVFGTVTFSLPKVP